MIRFVLRALHPARDLQRLEGAMSSGGIGERGADVTRFFMQIADQEAAARVLARTALAVATDARTALAVATAEPAAEPAARRKSKRFGAGVPATPYAGSKDAMSDSVRAAFFGFPLLSSACEALGLFAAAHTSRACRSGCLRAVDRV